MIYKILANNITKYAIKVNVTKYKKTLIVQLNTCIIINKVETANLTFTSFKLEKNVNLCLYYNCTKKFLEEVGGQEF